MKHSISRREFTKQAAVSAAAVSSAAVSSAAVSSAAVSSAAVSAALATAPRKATAAARGALHLSTNGYPWRTFYRRAGRDYDAELDQVLAEVAAAGLDGFEGNAGKPEDVDRLLPLLAKHDLDMRSLYVNSTLHDPQQVEASIQNILEIADKTKPAKTSVIVTNPNPIRWGGPENKSDQQLRIQAAALDRLGKALREKGITLAYHFHDIELRVAARELHHMMVGTDPDLVSLCLDAHWIYRGAGDSEVAVLDITKLYMDRIREVHIRQSRDGIWTEAFGPGDIDYGRLAQLLATHGVEPLLVLEQAVEKKSPHTLTAEQAHRQSVAQARRIFAPLNGRAPS